MNVTRGLGIVLLVVGIVLLAFGIHQTYAISEKVMENITGRFTDKTMYYIIGGVALVVGGLLLRFSYPRK